MALVIACNECFSLSLAGGVELNPLILRTIKQSVRQVRVETLPSGLGELCVDRCGHTNTDWGGKRANTRLADKMLTTTSVDRTKKFIRYFKSFHLI